MIPRTARWSPAGAGFGAGVEARAAKVFDWLGGWLAQPPGAAAVLAARRAKPITREFDEQS
jgi:hypothetical protein